MRTPALLLAAVLLSVPAAAQEIYRWVDRNGIVHYSDQPGAPGAERIQVRGGTDPVDPGGDETAAASGVDRSSPLPPDSGSYGPTRIIRPSADEVFFGTDVTIAAELLLDRPLRTGDAVVFYLDGEPLAPGGASTVLPSVPRGTHRLRAEVLDANGQVLTSAPQVTFHVRQASVATPPVGPALRPPPPRPSPPPTRPN